MPTCLPLIIEPSASAQSSITKSCWSSAIFIISGMLQGTPYKCTGIIAFVLAVICSFNNFIDIFHVFSSTSIRTGFAPVNIIAFKVAPNVMSGTITSSPTPIPKLTKAKCKATVPLLTASAYLLPVKCFTSFSNC